MTDEIRDRAPSAKEIEQRFSAMPIVCARPILLGAVGLLKVTLRFEWEARFAYRLQRLQGPLVFASNHRSHCDTAAILGTLPKAYRNKTAVAAALDVFGADSNGGLRRRVAKDLLQFTVASAFHAFAFDRYGPPLRSVRTSVDLIRNGWSLLLYPEGTRSRDGLIAPFKAGVGLLARFTERPVIPVHVEGGEEVLPSGGFLPRSASVLVRYGSPLWYQPNDTPVSFTAKVEEQVRLLDALAKKKKLATVAAAARLATRQA